MTGALQICNPRPHGERCGLLLRAAISLCFAKVFAVPAGRGWMLLFEYLPSDFVEQEIEDNHAG